MNMRLPFVGSGRFTVILLVLTVTALLVGQHMTTLVRMKRVEGEKAVRARDQADALANALEQYGIDFPDADPPANTREWAEKLGGHNPKNIRYLKIEKYSRDSLDRLIDPCGVPYVIDTPGTPGFTASIPEQAATEFHVRSGGCQEGLANGNRKNPRFPRPN